MSEIVNPIDVGLGLAAGVEWVDKNYGHLLNRTQTAELTRGLLELVWPRMELAAIVNLAEGFEQSVARMEKESPEQAQFLRTIATEIRALQALHPLGITTDEEMEQDYGK